MTRTLRKSLPRRRFGYPVQISIDFGDFIPLFYQHLMNSQRSKIKHSKKCFLRYPNTSKWVAPRFSTHFSVLGYSDETLFLVFDILLLKLIIKCGENEDIKSSKSMQIQTGYPNLLHGSDFLCVYREWVAHASLNRILVYF